MPASRMKAKRPNGVGPCATNKNAAPTSAKTVKVLGTRTSWAQGSSDDADFTNKLRETTGGGIAGVADNHGGRHASSQTYPEALRRKSSPLGPPRRLGFVRKPKNWSRSDPATFLLPRRAANRGGEGEDEGWFSDRA